MKAITRFVGRAPELATLGGWYAKQAYLMTVTGPPGVGKTRLVKAWAAQKKQVVCWVELADISDETGLIGSVAAALDIVLDASGDGVEQIGAVLGLRAGLVLVIDNAEHVVETLRSAIDVWCERAPDVCVVVTSRIALGLPQESVLALEPLSVPSGGGLEDSEAYALFCARAQHATPGWEPQTEEARRALQWILCHLDGLPLALEICASWIDLLSVEEIARRLERSSDLLNAVELDDPRYTSLTKAIAWSWQTLRVPERRALARLSVWGGKFSPEEAEAVLEGVDGPPALALVQALCSRNLLSRTSDHPGTTDVRMLLSVRAFARQMLREQGDLETTIAHATALMGLRAKQLFDGVELEESIDALQTLTRSTETFRTVLGWADAQTSPTEDHAWCLWAFAKGLVVSGLPKQAHDVLEQYAVWLSEESMGALWALVVRGEALFSMERHEESVAVLEALIPRLSALGHGDVEACARSQAALASMYVGAIVQARNYLAWEGDCGRFRARFESHRAKISHAVGERTEALHQYEVALKWARKLRDRHTETRVEHNLGIYFTDESQFELAEHHISRAMQHHRASGNRLMLAQAYNSAGVLYMRMSDAERAEKAYLESKAIWSESGLRMGLAMVLANLAMLWLDQGRYAQARECAYEAQSWCRGDEEIYVKAGAQLSVVYTLWFEGRVEEAFQTLERATRLFETLEHVQMKVSFLASKGALLAHLGDTSKAERAFERAQEALGEHGNPILVDLIAFHRCHLGIYVWRQALAKGDTYKANKALFRVVEAVKALGCSAERSRAEPLRYAERLLRLQLPSHAQLMLEYEETYGSDALLVDSSFRVFRAPMSPWEDLSRSPMLSSMLRALLHHFLEEFGEVISVQELQEKVWPGETMVPESASNRMHVAVSKLRKMGLRGVLEREGEGYRLDLKTTVHVIDLWGKTAET